MPFMFNPIAGQEQVKPNQQKQQNTPPPDVGGTDTQAAPQSGGQYNLNNSSVYLNETNQANLAYEKAKSQLLANRNSLYHQYGLTDQGAVDVNDPYGQYQAMLGSEGAALDSAHNDSVARGLGSGGLANQAEASLIPGQRAEQLNFQHMVDDAGGQYASGLNDAENQRTSSIDQGYQDALQDALARGLFDAAPTAPPTTTTPNGTKTNKTTTPVKFVYNPKISANKTGASARKRGGIYSIH